MNVRLVNFGLARIHDHHGHVVSTRIIGTKDTYIALKVIRTIITSTMFDVFGFGILVLEVVYRRIL